MCLVVLCIWRDFVSSDTQLLSISGVANPWLFALFHAALTFITQERESFFKQAILPICQASLGQFKGFKSSILSTLTSTRDITVGSCWKEKCSNVLTVWPCDSKGAELMKEVRNIYHEFTCLFIQSLLLGAQLLAPLPFPSTGVSLIIHQRMRHEIIHLTLLLLMFDDRDQTGLLDWFSYRGTASHGPKYGRRSDWSRTYAISV